MACLSVSNKNGGF